MTSTVKNPMVLIRRRESQKKEEAGTPGIAAIGIGKGSKLNMPVKLKELSCAHAF